MHRRWDAIPSVEEEPEENGLGEERETFERKRHANNGTRFFHKAWPQQPEFKRQHGPGNGADCEQDRGAARPAFAQLKIDRLLGLEIKRLRNRHQDRHADPCRGEDNMKCQRQSHLRSRIKKVAHRVTILEPYAPKIKACTDAKGTIDDVKLLTMA